MRGGSVEAEGLFGLLIFASLAKEVGLADIGNPAILSTRTGDRRLERRSQCSGLH